MRTCLLDVNDFEPNRMQRRVHIIGFGWGVGSPHIRSLSEWRVRYWSWKEGISRKCNWQDQQIKKNIPLCWWEVTIARGNSIRFNEAEHEGRANYDTDSYDEVESACHSLFPYSAISSICIRRCIANGSCCRWIQMPFWGTCLLVLRLSSLLCPSKTGTSTSSQTSLPLPINTHQAPHITTRSAPAGLNWSARTKKTQKLSICTNVTRKTRSTVVPLQRAFFRS